MDVSIVVSLLPLFFLLHELEEIIMVRSWLDKNQAALRERFSNLGYIIVWMEQMTTRRFIVVAAEEFIIVSLCTLMCLYFGKIVVWYCCLAAFAIHLVVHFIQFVVWKGYIPAIFTTAFCLPYCFWAMIKTYSFFSLYEMFVNAFIGIILCVLNLIVMHMIVKRHSQ